MCKSDYIYSLDALRPVLWHMLLLTQSLCPVCHKQHCVCLQPLFQPRPSLHEVVWVLCLYSFSRCLWHVVVTKSSCVVRWSRGWGRQMLTSSCSGHTPTLALTCDDLTLWTWPPPTRSLPLLAPGIIWVCRIIWIWRIIWVCEINWVVWIICVRWIIWTCWIV